MRAAAVVSPAVRRSARARGRQATLRAVEEVTPRAGMLADKIAGMADAQIMCRTEGHWWPSPGDAGYKWGAGPRQGVMLIEQHCQRGCGVWRSRFTTRSVNGVAIDHSETRMHYEDAPGYSLREEWGWDYDKDRLRLEAQIRGGVIRAGA